MDGWIDRSILQMNPKKTEKLIGKWTEELNRYLTKEHIQMAIKKCGSILKLFRNQEIKTVRYHHLIPS